MPVGQAPIAVNQIGHFPNEIDILQQKYYSAYGISDDKKCGLVFNNVESFVFFSKKRENLS